jgi:hypothetical protein
LQDIFGHPMFEPCSNHVRTSRHAGLAREPRYGQPAEEQSSADQSAEKEDSSLRRDYFPRFNPGTDSLCLHSASTSIAETIAELSGVALRRIESQQLQLQQMIDSLTPFATIASPPAIVAKQTIQPSPTTGPAASPAPSRQPTSQ